MTEFNSYKITLDEAAVKNKLISNLPNRPQMTPQELKSYFDYLPVTVLGLTKLNGLIDYLDSAGAADLGITVDGLVAKKVQAAIEELLTAILAVKGGGWTNENATKNANDINLIKGENWNEETIKGNALEIDLIKGEGWTSETLKMLGDYIDLIKGENWEKETIKGNAENLLAHKQSADHDARYPLKTTLGAYGGIATLDLDGKLSQTIDASKVSGGELPLSVIPAVAKLRNVSVENFAEALKLTITDIQNGDFVVIEDEIAWYQVVNDEVLGTNAAFRKVPTGVVGQAIMSQQYDANYVGGNSIAIALSEKAKQIDLVETNERVSLAESAISANSSNIGSNAVRINELESSKADKSQVAMLNCVHSKVGAVHTFTSLNKFIEGVNIYLLSVKLNSSILEGETLSVTDGNKSYTNFSAVMPNGEFFELTIDENKKPTINFNVNLEIIEGDSRLAVFAGGGGKNIINQSTPPQGKDGLLWINDGIIKYWDGTAWANIYGVYS